MEAVAPLYGQRPGEDVGVVGEQVQRPALVGHLLGAVGPHRRPEGVLVDARPRLRRSGAQDRRPVLLAERLAVAVAMAGPGVMTRAQRVDGEARVGEEAVKSWFIVTDRTVASFPVLEPEQSRAAVGPSRCGIAVTRLDEVPDAGRARHRVEQVGAFRLTGVFVEEEAVQRLAGVRHLLHRAAGRAGRCGVTVPSSLALTPGPAMGAPSVSSAGQSTVSHGQSERIEAVAARVAGARQSVKLVRGQQVQRAILIRT